MPFPTARKLLLLLSITAAVMASPVAPPNGASTSSISYSHVSGFFAQDLNETDDKSFDFIKSNFGILEKFEVLLPECGVEATKTINKTVEERWSAFLKVLGGLNEAAPAGTEYKVLYLARHGQGFHNVAEAYYGTAEWDRYWSKLEGNGTVTWADAELTEQGQSEADKAGIAWEQQRELGAPLPESFYSSPLRRAASTLEITWKDIEIDHELRPLIKEKLRETMGEHTCDRRSKKSELEEIFPAFEFEEGFSEEDLLWDPDVRESDEERDARLDEGLKEVLEKDKSTFISITAHGGAITSILKNVGHRKFSLQTGGMIPMVIKVVRT